MPAERFSGNPILCPSDVTPSRPDFEVLCVINAGVARVGEEVLLLLRVVERPRSADPDEVLVPIYDPAAGQVTLRSFRRGTPGYGFSDPRGISTPNGYYLTALSHLRVARSRDYVHFTVDREPALFPANEYETYGIEDPRITRIGEDYYVNYVAVSNLGIVTALARTRDFRHFERLGVIFAPDNKDVLLFPEEVGGRYYALHRPSVEGLGHPEIWIAESPDLLCWGNHRRLAGLRANGWEDARLGGSVPPIRIPQGWLEIYHGATKQPVYHLGALLLDAERPWQVLGRSRRPILSPEADYEVNGFFGNVVFSCGALLEGDDLHVYYGAADTSMAYARLSLREVLDGLEG